MDFDAALKAIQKGRWVRRVDWPEGQYAFRSSVVPDDYYERLGWKPELSHKGSEEFSALRIKLPDGTVEGVLCEALGACQCPPSP